MHTRTFGRLGWPVSEVGYGLWGMGGWTGSDDLESLASLERAIEMGCTFFDTALAYGDGKSEQLLGTVLAKHRNRGLIVATKIPPERWQRLAHDVAEDPNAALALLVCLAEHRSGDKSWQAMLTENGSARI